MFEVFRDGLIAPDCALKIIDSVANNYLKSGDTLAYYTFYHVNKSQIYLNKNNISKAIEHIQQYIERMQDITNVELGHAFIELGNMYYKLGYYEVARDIYYQAITQSKMSKNWYNYDVPYNNIALCYKRLKNYDSALYHIEKILAFRLSEDAHNHSAIYNFYQMAECWRLKGNFQLANFYSDSGISFFNSLLKQPKVVNGANAIYVASLMLEKLYYQLSINSYEEALQYQKKIIDFLDGYNLHHNFEEYYLLLAEAWITAGNFRMALKNLGEFEELSNNQSDLITQLEYRRLMMLAAQGMKKNDLSLIHEASYYKLKDSLDRLYEPKYLVQLVNKTLTKQKELLEIERDKQLKKSDELLSQEIKIRKITLLGLLLMGLGLLTVIYFYRIIVRDKNKISHQNKEKTLLLREIHHRVKNNLAVVSGILSMQERETTESLVKEKLKHAKSRIESIALVHKHLYEQENFDKINVQTYFNNLYISIYNTFLPRGLKLACKIDCEATTMELDTLVPLSLITNELITNSMKYAFEGRTEGTIKISIKEEENMFMYEYKDDGIGFSINEHHHTGLGSVLVEGLIEQLKGKIVKYDGKNGINFLISFPFAYT